MYRFISQFKAKQIALILRIHYDENKVLQALFLGVLSFYDISLESKHHTFEITMQIRNKNKKE